MNGKERAEWLFLQSAECGGLIVTNLEIGDGFVVGLDGTFDGVRVEDDRELTLRVENNQFGNVRILSDSGSSPNWAGRIVNLGSLAMTDLGSSMSTRTSKVVDSFIAEDSGAAIDFSLRRFQNPESVRYLLARYGRLVVNGVEFF